MIRQIKHTEAVLELNVKAQEKQKLDNQVEQLKLRIEQEVQLSKSEREKVSSLEQELAAVKAELSGSSKMNLQLQSSVGAAKGESAKLGTEISRLTGELGKEKTARESAEKRVAEELEKLAVANEGIVLLHSELESLEAKAAKEKKAMEVRHPKWSLSRRGLGMPPCRSSSKRAKNPSWSSS